jgi:hypothetical protein
MEERIKLHPDEIVVDDVFLAAFCQYLGHTVYKCVNGNGTKFTFLIPSCDFEIIQQEFASAETGIFVRSFTRAIKDIYSFQNQARRSGGEYISPAWRDVIRQRQEAQHVG